MLFRSSASPALLEWMRGEVIQTFEFVASATVRSLNDADTHGSLPPNQNAFAVGRH
jgi:hypothetical protein